MGRLQSLQVGRAIAALGVVFYHLMGLSVDYQNGCFYQRWMEIPRSGVDIFFVISGVVMVATTYRKIGLPGTGRRFLIHRVSRIYPPYLTLTALLTVFWILKPNAVNSKHGGVDLFSSYTLWPSTKLPLLPVAWTLTFEMIFYIAFLGIILFVKKRWFVHALTIWGAIVLAASLFIWTGGWSRAFFELHSRSVGRLLNPLILEFIVGCFIGLGAQKIRFVAGKVCVIAGSVLFAAEAVLEQFGVINNFFGSATDLVQIFLVPAALIVYGLVAWERNAVSFHPPQWLIRCGDMSYSIYLVHILVIHASYRYAWRFLHPFGITAVFLVVTAAAAIFASVVFYKLVEKPFSTWTKDRLEGIAKVQPKPVVGVVAS
jgi:peptidoglycan/LPS O-acetylase OafA/YrhL